MKKCLKCRIVFQKNDRINCLYCDSKLAEVEFDDTKDDDEDFLKAQGSLVEFVLRERDILKLYSIQYIIGSYFRTRTFHFNYNFYRNEFKMGKIFKRGLIQPLTFSSLLMIPWVIVDFFDSVLFRMLYQEHCPKCNWKYVPKSGGGKVHDPEECEYNQEYAAIVEDILSGKITRTEVEIEKESMKKLRDGKRSAYYELCAGKRRYDNFLDVACVWVSSSVLVFFIVWTALPFTRYMSELIQTFE